MTSTDLLASKASVLTSTAVANVLGLFDRATAADIEAGASWYGADATSLVSDLARLGNVTREHAAAVLSHLSPRTTWARNVAGATAMLAAHAAGADTFAAGRAAGCLGANVARAARALVSEDPIGTFGRTAPKTRSFALNLLGDRDAVTVDVWALRAALDPSWARGDAGELEKVLGRVGVYGAVADVYRAAAAARGVTAQTMQATVWVVIRNGRAG